MSSNDDDYLSRWLEEQTARQELLLASLAPPSDELLAELAEQSARAAELLLAQQERPADK
jgi:hypothetical protein